MSDTLNVKRREERGTRAMSRLRAGGEIPAVLYGHGQETVSLRLRVADIYSAINHGAQLFDLKGDVNESALLREVQWDALGSDVIHVDFTRVDATEMVETTVSIELRGDAPGTHDGGVVEQPLHEVDIECPAAQIPEKFEININTLELNGSVTAGDLELPKGGKLITDPSQIVVHCVVPTVVEEEGASAEGAEPELVGKGDEEEGDEED